MSSGKPGEEGDSPPHEAGGRADTAHAAPTPRPQVRGNTPLGDSLAVQAADTATALALDVGRSAHPKTTVPNREQDTSDSGMLSMSALVGTTLAGRYRIERKIGQGGMGAVFEGVNLSIGRRVAVKVLLDEFARRESIVARLEQEARLATTIGHEHIVDMLDFGQTDDGRTFVVMEYLEGESLAECLHREGSMAEPRILRIAQQVASALGAAHNKGVVHRDVKPENVFLLRRNELDFAKVVDFGISKSMRVSDDAAQRLTQTGMVLGTPLYMSPEQARGEDDLDHRIDIYAVGVIMYEAATGRVPFSGSNYLAVISQVLSDDPPNPRQLRPELSAEFEGVILKAMAKERDRRYQSMAELGADVATLLDSPANSAERARLVAAMPAHRRSKTRRNLIWGAAIAVLVVSTTLAVASFSGGHTPRSQAIAAVVDAALAPPPALDAAPAPPEKEMLEFFIESTPPGAEIFAGNKYLGRAPTKFFVEADAPEQVLYARLEGHNDGELRITPRVDLKQFPDRKIPMRLERITNGRKPRVPVKPAPATNSGSSKDNRTPAGGGDLGGNPYGN